MKTLHRIAIYGQHKAFTITISHTSLPRIVTLNKSRMLRRYCPVSYKHVLVSDSETESDDDNAGSVAVLVGLKKGNGQGSRIDKGNVRSKSKRNGKGKNLVLADEANEVANKPFEAKTNVDRDALVELARKYQNRLKKMPIPQARLRDAVVVNWQGLAKTLKNLYGQPLHYMTYMLCKQWDQSRFGSDDEGKPLDAIFKWNNAESTIWHVEEIHRLCTSPIHLAMLWLSDPEYHAFVDEVIPSP